MVFVFNWGGIKPQRTPDKEVWPNPIIVLAWVANVSTSPKLYIELSTPVLVETFHIWSQAMTKPLLDSFGESPKACVTNSSHPPEKLKVKENPDLPSVCSNYWPPNVALSLCFNPLVLSTFRQCRSAMPKRSAKPIASNHHTVQCPWRNPYVICIHAIV